MRDPYNLKSIDYHGEKITTLNINNVPEFDMQDWDLLDEKQFKKYISNIERLIRGSLEYRQMIQYLRENLNMCRCSFYENVNNLDSFKIRIEIHHEPFSLYDLCIIVYNKRCYYHESLEENLVAKEVMFLHYKLMVGLIPLAQTVHELVHSGYIFIPLDKVYGNYRDFLNMYQDFMSPEQIDIIDRCIEYTKTYNSKIIENHVLDKHYVYVDPSGAYDLPKLEDVISIVNARIKELKSKPKDIPVIDAMKRV